MPVTDKPNGAKKACELAGGQRCLARALTERGVRITPQAIGEWVRKSGAVPAGAKAIAVSQITGLSLHELNPTAYPAEYAAS